MKRVCYHIPVDQKPDRECGYRVAVVEEDEPGYRWTGDTPEGGRQQPYYWGHSLEDAQAIARSENRRLGLTDQDVLEIVNSSIRAQLFSQGKRGTIH